MRFLQTVISLIVVSQISQAEIKNQIPHMDLEMSSREMQSAYKDLIFLQAEPGAAVADPLDAVVSTGKRNLEWLDFINSHRDANSKIHLTQKGSLVGYPIEAPRMFNDKTVVADFQKLVQELPNELKSVLIDGKSFTQAPPIKDQDYAAFALRLDRIYQFGIRYKLLKPYLGSLVYQRAKDIRGLYFFSKDQDLEKTLSGWATFPEEKKAQYRDWMTSMCYNNRGYTNACNSEVKTAEANGKLYNLFQQYKSNSQNTWNDYFVMPQTRSDVRWVNTQQQVAYVPFVTPADSKILSFLRDNIEEEWQNSDWKLVLDFQQNAPISSTPHVVFQPGVTPHVDGIAGNTITMDQNSLIDEWDVQWTIRHEFGHVLGFTDCYLEYYDSNAELIVGYQLDITNLMCSRRGVFQKQHYDQMKAAYSK